tara:strand:+ start:695 stop:1231 length:537 start_codon:yes stop_codon:yes gene_type:complete
MGTSVYAGGNNSSSSSDSRYFFGIGAGDGGGFYGGYFTAYRLSYQKILSHNSEYSFKYFSDTGLNFWKDDSRLSEFDKTGATSGLSSSNLSVSYSRGIRKYVSKNSFLDIGLGLSLHSSDSMGGSDLGTTIHIESRIGLGYERETYRSVLNLFHYSNGGRSEKNDGVDVLMLSVSKYF